MYHRKEVVVVEGEDKYNNNNNRLLHLHNLHKKQKLFKDKQDNQILVIIQLMMIFQLQEIVQHVLNQSMDINVKKKELI